MSGFIPFKCQTIGESERRDHPHLVESDRCVYAIEYFPDRDLSDKGKSFIINLKKKISSPPSELPYKAGVIRHAIDELTKHFQKSEESFFVVPIPPSYMRSDREYDDRLMKILRGVRSQLGKEKFYACDLIEMKENIPSSHSGGTRDIEELKNFFNIREEAIPTEEVIRRYDHFIIFDDVIVTGAHFKATQRLLSENLLVPVSFKGLFIARRAIDFAAMFKDVDIPD